MSAESRILAEPIEPSLPEVHASVRISRSPIFWRRLLGFLGPGFLISVGYMDPGNWATDIAGGSRFGYTLLFVIMASNLIAVLLQSLSLKLGVATDRDLAQLCHEAYGRRVSFVLWLGAEIAIAACDLAEVIGSAIALNLLFHIPLLYGVLITGLDVLLILLLQRWGFRYVEALVIALIGTIIAMFGVQMFLSRPDYWPVRHQPRHAVHRDWNAGRDGDAAQSLSPLLDCAEPEIQADAGGQARSHLHGQRGLGAGADSGAVCECGNSDCGGGGVLSQRAL
jgi:manganese transport protein